MRFTDRQDAGRRLATALMHYRGEDVVIFALPRGGVPVAAPIAEALHAPLTLALVRKIGVPDQPEVAMGAIADVGASVLVRNDDVIAATGVSLSRDNTTSRTSITATAKYALTETASGRTLYTSTSRATDAYDVLVSDFGTLVSRDDAVNRALREVSDDIRTQLAIYFQDKRDNGATSRRVKATGAN